MVRKARPDEAGEIAAVLARAFYDDPVMTWTFPGHAKRELQARRFFATRLKYLLAQEQVYTTDDLSGAAIWALPDRFHVGLRETVELALPLVGPRLPMLYHGLRRLEKRHPHEPRSFYLAVLGTDPPRQGKGIGSALMQPVLELCDGDGVPAYLESSKESNVAFYARHGFRVTEEVRLPRGPRMWPMWREPLGSGRI